MSGTWTPFEDIVSLLAAPNLKIQPEFGSVFSQTCADLTPGGSGEAWQVEGARSDGGLPRPWAPVGRGHYDRRFGRSIDPAPLGAAAGEHKRVHLALLDHAELEILIIGCVGDRMPVVHAEHPPVDP